MKLTHCDIETIFTSDKVNVITVENPRRYRQLYVELRDSIRLGEERFVLSEKDKIINLSRNAVFVDNPIELDFSDKKANNKLLAELSDIANEKYAEDVLEINSRFFSLLDKLNIESTIETDWNVDSPITAMFKAFGVMIADKADNGIERLIDYVTMLTHFLGIRLIAFANLKSFFETYELQELYKHLMYNGVMCMDIESGLKPKCDGEMNLVIDNDLCEIIV